MSASGARRHPHSCAAKNPGSRVERAALKNANCRDTCGGVKMIGGLVARAVRAWGGRDDGGVGERATSADAPLRAMELESSCSEHFLKTCGGEGGQSGKDGHVSEMAWDGAKKIHQRTPSVFGAKETRGVERERPSRTFARMSSSVAISSVVSRREGSSCAVTAPLRASVTEFSSSGRERSRDEVAPPSRSRRDGRRGRRPS